MKENLLIVYHINNQVIKSVNFLRLSLQKKCISKYASICINKVWCASDVLKDGTSRVPTKIL